MTEEQTLELLKAILKASHLACPFSSSEFEKSLYYKTETGGSKGGDCYGGRTSGYHVDSWDQAQNIGDNDPYIYAVEEHAPEYVSAYRGRLSEIAYDMVEAGSISDDSDHSDFYGNYSEYGTFETSLMEFFKTVLNENDFQLFQAAFTQAFNDVMLEVDENTRTQRVENLEQQLRSFEHTGANNLVYLKQREEQVARELKDIRQQIAQFDKNQEANKAYILKELQQLTGRDYNKVEEDKGEVIDPHAVIKKARRKKT